MQIVLKYLVCVPVSQSLIPDIKVNQEAVVELHPEELQLSGDEENLDTSRSDQGKGLKIQRTVTQVRRCISALLAEKLKCSFFFHTSPNRNTKRRFLLGYLPSLLHFY